MFFYCHVEIRVKSSTLYNSCVRVRVRVTRRKKFYKKQGKTAAKPETAHGIRQTERIFYTDKEELFTVPLRKTYGSATQNVRFAKGKHKNNGNVTRFSTQGLQKNRLQMKS